MTRRHPVRVAGVREYPLGEELLVYLPARQIAHALNASARAIWDLCDGSRSAEDIARELGTYLPSPPPTLRDDVTRMLAELRDLGLVEDR